MNEPSERRSDQDLIDATKVLALTILELAG
jgi:hypothetical protein